MAEGFARALGGPDVHVESAGSRPSGTVNARAIAFMAERGVDIAGQRSEGLPDGSGPPYDVVITMGCGDACPHVPARRRVDWDLADPKALDDAGFRAVRDDIERRVRTLLH